MADPIFSCIPARPIAPLQVTIPGIGVLQSIKNTVDGVPTPSSLAMSMLGQVSPALAPLMGILRLVDVVVQLEQALKDVTNPIALAGDLEKLATNIGLLGDFIPGIAYAKTVRDLLDMISALLSGIASKITRWVSESQAISAALASAQILNDPDLANSANCAITRLAEAQGSAQVSLQEIGQILKVVKLIADIISAVVPISVPGISDITDAIDTLATAFVSEPGALGSAAENERMLSLADTLNKFAGEIHHLSVSITQIIGQ